MGYVRCAERRGMRYSGVLALHFSTRKNGGQGDYHDVAGGTRSKEDCGYPVGAEVTGIDRRLWGDGLMKEGRLCLERLSQSLRRFDIDSVLISGGYNDGKYAIKPKRKVGRPRVMNSYQKKVLDVLACMYSGDELEEKLAELQFCTVEQAYDYYMHREEVES